MRFGIVLFATDEKYMICYFYCYYYFCCDHHVVYSTHTHTHTLRRYWEENKHVVLGGENRPPDYDSLVCTL